MSLVRLLSQLNSSLWQVVGEKLPTEGRRNKVDAPILSAQEIMDYAKVLERTAAKMPANPHQSEALRQGEQSSRFMGSGMEYEESRPYQLGDEIRRINWRLMARTGQAYTKLYQEERQENWFILTDHRASMRFGTRKRLKATQAARVAGYYAWLAQQAGIPVSVGRLAEGFAHSPIFEGKSVYERIMQFVCQPCPPFKPQDSSTEPHINDVLLNLMLKLQPGTRLIILSDFHDVNQETTEVLTAMQDFLSIKAVWIQDTSESSLPNIDGLQLQSMVNDDIYDIANSEQRANYQAWVNDYQAALQHHLQAANVGVYALFANDSLQQINLTLSQSKSYSSGAV